jgi:hypothetical protein
MANPNRIAGRTPTVQYGSNTARRLWNDLNWPYTHLDDPSAEPPSERADWLRILFDKKPWAFLRLYRIA